MAMAVTQPESFTFEIEHHARDSFQMLDHMHKEGMLCDITVVAKNVEIPVHKNVLASSSPYFYSMFTNPQTAKQERIELDVNPQVLLSIISYMYTSKLTVIEENIMDLLELAKLLLLHGVQIECSNILKHTLRPNNCFYIKRVAISYGNSKLVDSTSSYIDDNFVEAVASTDFLNLTSNEVAELISRDSLNVPSEEKVYESIVRWINHDSKGRRKYLRLLMECVRLHCISKDYLKQHIIEESFLKGDYYCKDLIIKALSEKDTAAIPIKCRRYKRDERVLLLIGGSREASNSLEYYSFEERHWSNTLEMPFNVSHSKLAIVNQKLYVIGGWRNNRCVKTVNCYDINTNDWDQINDMLTIRKAHGLGVLNNCIYVVGGSDGRYCLDSAEKFDIETQNWSHIAPLLEKRRSFGVGVIDGILYAVGGAYDNSDALKTVECYSHFTNSWRKLSNMNCCRSGLGVCVLDGQLYAIGGYDGMCRLPSMEVYTPHTDSWTTAKPMQVARSRLSVAVIDNKIYVTGGYNGDCSLNLTEIYDKVTDSWTFLPESMNVPRMWHAAVVVDKHS